MKKMKRGIRRSPYRTIRTPESKASVVAMAEDGEQTRVEEGTEEGITEAIAESNTNPEEAK